MRVLLLPMVLLHAAACAQELKSIHQAAIPLVSVQVGYAHQWPGGDLASRFRDNSNLGLGVWRKGESQWLVGVEGSFLFGNKVIEPGILSNVINSAGQVLDQDGVMADVFLFQRGWTVFGVGGKLLPVIGPNPNSGLVLKAGVGYMRHKVRVQTQKNVVPQLEDDYLEGYDRLSAGPAALGYLGYQHFGKRRFVNYHIGAEVMAGFTQPLRAFNFDTEQPNSGNRFDLLTGIRAGLSLPIYRKPDEKFRY
ncbi:MAG: hypothetical protein IPF41_09420 [Flavobacteriales bacterium]|nr:hypothetical protein [Flavobacteriales bacterium]